MQVVLDGVTHEFPDDATDQEISQALGGNQSPDYAKEAVFGIPRGIAKGGALIAKGIGQLAAGAQDTLGGPGSGDKYRRMADEFSDYVNKSVGSSTTLPGKFVEGVSQFLPAIGAGLATGGGCCVSSSRSNDFRWRC